MQNKIQLSIIIPVYNRPEEVQELLMSLTRQTCPDFSVVVVEDGSSYPCESVVKKFQNKLKIHYLYQKKAGAASARNLGMREANGNYFIFLDSDCILPKTYIQEVLSELNNEYIDGFGGPDAAHESFTDLQKAINYAMTSFFTTGGIRGGTRRVQYFQPRSFNMGLSREVFKQTHGFGKIFPGEDSDLALRIWEKGFATRLFSKAAVYHKRRVSFSKFSAQVYAFGKVRPMLNYFHPNYKKITFWLPALFMLGSLFSVLFFLFSFVAHSVLFKIPMACFACYLLLVFADAIIKNKSIKIGALSIIAVLVQFFSYGAGFLYAQIHINLLKKNPREAFPKHFKDEK